MLVAHTVTATQRVLSIDPQISLVNMSLYCRKVLVSLLFYKCFNLQAPGMEKVEFNIISVLLVGV